MSATTEKKSVVVSDDQKPALVPKVVPMIGTCINLISGIYFYMEIFMKKFTWSNL